MKTITNQSLLGLMGGAKAIQCDYLQVQANEHVPLEDKAAEDAWWEAWGEAFERCALSITD